MKNNQTGQGLGDEGVQTLSEALKTNTTLQTLNLCREQGKSEKVLDKLQKLPTTNINQQRTALAMKEHKH